MKTTLTILCVLGSLSAFSQSSVLIEPNRNNGLFSKNNTTILPSPIGSGGPNTLQPPAIGAGTRLMWIPQLSALRAGTVTGTQWDAANIGTWSTAFGYSNIAIGAISTTWGNSNYASGYSSTAWGNTTTANGSSSTAWGNSNYADGSNSTAWGYGNAAQGDNTTALGEFTTAQAYDSFVMGRYNIVAGHPFLWNAAEPLFVIGNGTAHNARSNAVTVLKNGNVGIGTPTPDAPLHITGAGTSNKLQ